jgi:LPS O-antigen subunit length determinant protein (WzzB/FepE family)
MEEKTDDDEIFLIDLFAVLWWRKVTILVITLAAAAGIAAFSVASVVLPPESSPLPNVYTPMAIMLINDASFY